MRDDITLTTQQFVTRLLEKKGKLPSPYEPTFDYMRSGHVDSMGLIKFMLAIEAEFDIEISEDDMLSPDFRTLGGLVRLIEQKRSVEVGGHHA